MPVLLDLLHVNSPFPFSLLVPLTKFMLRLRLAFIKCSGLARTKFKLRLWLAFTKCSAQKSYHDIDRSSRISVKCVQFVTKCPNFESSQFFHFSPLVCILQLGIQYYRISFFNIGKSIGNNRPVLTPDHDD